MIRPDSPWSPLQIKVVHIYANLARMTDTEYRAFLQTHTLLGRYHHGAITSKDRRLTQLDFDRFMPAIEADVWTRVDTGLASPPTGKWARRDYWARQCGVLGMMTTRQRWWIDHHWPDLRSMFGYADTYLDAMMTHATAGACTRWQDASSAQAEALINAIADRLQHAPPAAAECSAARGAPL